MLEKEKFSFHQATIRICGSLEIDQALMRCFNYLKDFIPMDVMRLEEYDQDMGAVRLIASANPIEGKKLDKLIPLPQTARDAFEKKRLTEVKIINHPEQNPMSKFLASIFGKAGSSIMVLPLIMDGLHVGSVGVSVAGINRYTDDHARLLTMLHDPFAIAMANILKHEELLKLKDLLTDENLYLTQELRHFAGDEIVGTDSGLKHVMEMVRQVAPRDNPVLLLGETGVGKELIANAIHYSSLRKEGPFIKVNCGAIPDTLMDSELFGHEKGAFTGAFVRKRGRFERAHMGTIFLDEIGDLPLQAQVRLLRVFQQKEIERVGGTETIPVNIRIIAATHQNLETMVESGGFREDLYFRLNVFPIIIPHLRQRKADIPALVGLFLKRKAKELNFHEIPPIATGAIDRLMSYQWKGNVRELENVVERALLLYKSGTLSFDHFVFSQSDETSISNVTGDKIDRLNDLIAQHIQRALIACDGKINGAGGAAELLDIHPNTLRNKMNKLGIQYGRKN